MAAPLRVEVIAHAPTVFYPCEQCEWVWRETGFSREVRTEQLRNGLPEDLQREYEAVSDWVYRLLNMYPDRVEVTVIDAASMGGVWRLLRHGVHRLPAVVVKGRERYVGTDFRAAGEVVARCVESSVAE